MSPTYESRSSFGRDLSRLTPEQRKRFLGAVAEMVADLRAGRPFRPGLRIRRIAGTQHLWEMTFAPDGRATWQYGSPRRGGDPHIVWRRIGNHDVFRQP